MSQIILFSRPYNFRLPTDVIFSARYFVSKIDETRFYNTGREGGWAIDDDDGGEKVAIPESARDLNADAPATRLDRTNKKRKSSYRVQFSIGARDRANRPSRRAPPSSFLDRERRDVIKWSSLVET